MRRMAFALAFLLLGPVWGDGAFAQSGQGMPSSLAADFEVRLQRMERTLSELTGRYEEALHELNQLRDRMERMNGDVDFRLQALESGGQGGSRPAAPARPAAQAEARPAPQSQPAQPQAQPEPASPPARPQAQAQLGTLPPPGSSTARDPQAQYDAAFDLIRQNQLAQAEQAFSEFLSRNRNHPLAGNAQYWLAETHYARNQFPQAAVAFAEGMQKYPKSTKAPDSLLKLGMSLGALNRRDDACTAFAQLLKNYPDASASIRRRAESERQRLTCTR